MRFDKETDMFVLDSEDAALLDLPPEETCWPADKSDGLTFLIDAATMRVYNTADKEPRGRLAQVQHAKEVIAAMGRLQCMSMEVMLHAADDYYRRVDEVLREISEGNI